MNTLPDNATYGELYGPAMRIETREEARAYLATLVDRVMSRTGMNRDDAERQERTGLNYYAGYYDEQTRRRVAALFRAAP